MRMTWMAAGCAAMAMSFSGAGQDAAPAFDDADALLQALETAADDIDSLQAQINYDRRFLLQGDRHIRRGMLYFAQRESEDGQRRRVFEVDFQVLFLVNDEEQRREEDRQVWTFDGRWLVEKRPDKKQYIAREVAPPGATFDPLRLGEGPIPIPLGQAADEVLARYSAMLLPTEDGLLPDEDASLIDLVTSGAGSWQLRLDPRSEDDDFEEIRLWYSKGSLLPRMALTTNRSGDVSVVQLAQVTINETLPETVFDVTPPAIGSGWDTQIEEYRGE